MVQQRVLGVSLWIALLTSCGGAESLTTSVDTQKAKRPKSIELTLEYEHEAKKLTLVSQRFTDKIAPRRRNKATVKGQLALECKNGRNTVIDAFAVDDPSLLYADWEHEGGEPGALDGQVAYLPSSTFRVVVPFSKHLATVGLKKPRFRRDGTVEAMESAGQTAVDRRSLDRFE